MAAPGHLRRPLARVHRWLGLALGGWFALLGLTGSALVWHDEIDAWLNPKWFAPLPACPRASDAPISTALARFAAATGGAHAIMVSAPHVPEAAYVVWDRAAPDGPRRQHFIDVACDRYLGMRTWGAARLDSAHFVPAMYELHRSLLAGEIGHGLVGSGGLIVLVLVVLGMVLAWPRRARRQTWARALTVRRGHALRVGFELHRAVGLWLLPFLLLMTLTGVYLCFPQQGRSVVAAFLPTLADGGRRGSYAADERGQSSAFALLPDRLVRVAEAQWSDARWSRLQLPTTPGSNYEVRLLQTAEPRKDTGDTRVRLTVQGDVLSVRDALGGPTGETLMRWLFPLHSGEALGTIGRLLWTVFGLVPALLFATAAWLWWRRTRAPMRRSAGCNGASRAGDGQQLRSATSVIPQSESGSIDN